MGFWDAVASAGPYAKNLHLTPDKQPHQHLIAQFLQIGCSFWCQTDSDKALKANSSSYAVALKTKVGPEVAWLTRP